MSIRSKIDPHPESRTKLLQAAIHLVRRQGFASTSVDDICREAGLTKGAFFHNFESKEAMGAEAARYWSTWTGGLFASAAYHQIPDPLERILGYLELRESLLDLPVEAFTCYAGTTLQECHATSEPIRTACADSITSHAATLEQDFDLALHRRGGIGSMDGASLALHTQAVLQGAFILAKATGSAAIVRDSIAHLRRYLLLLLDPDGGIPERSARAVGKGAAGAAEDRNPAPTYADPKRIAKNTPTPGGRT